jgi:ketosteroid isomerase-like protein
MASAHEITVRAGYDAANRRDMDAILAGSHAEVEVRRSRASAVPFEAEIFHVTTMRDGLIVRVEGFGDRDSARRALEAT